MDLIQQYHDIVQYNNMYSIIFVTPPRGLKDCHRLCFGTGLGTPSKNYKRGMIM